MATEMECRYMSTSKSLKDSTEEIVKEEISTVATQWGLNVVRVMGNGDCFFSSVAFQLLQLLQQPNLQSEVREHLMDLGVNLERSLSENAQILRRHVVAEWTGPFMDEYR